MSSWAQRHTSGSGSFRHYCEIRALLERAALDAQEKENTLTKVAEAKAEAEAKEVRDAAQYVVDAMKKKKA